MRHCLLHAFCNLAKISATQGDTITMKRTPERPREYRITRLIDALADAHQTGHQFEMGLSERIGRQLKQDPLCGKFERAAFVPTTALARDLQTTPASSGGNLIADSVAAVAAATRPQIVLEAIGAERIEIAGESVALPRWNGGTGGWIVEGAEAPQLATTVSSVELHPRGAAARISISRKLRVQGEDIEAQIQAELSRAVRNVVEGGLIAGTGTNGEPLGLLNTTGRQTTTFSGATPTFAELMAMVELLGDANHGAEDAAFLVHPSDLATLLSTEKATNSGQMIAEHVSGSYRIAGIPVASSSHVTEGSHVLCIPNAIKLGFFGSPIVTADPYRNLTTGAVEVVVINFVDVGVQDSSSLVIGSA